MVVLAGGNSVGVKIATDELDDFWAAALRFGASGALFAILMIPLRSPLPHGKALLGAVTYGVLAFGMAFGLAFVAIPMTGAGAGQLLLGLVPLLTLILAPLHGLEPFRLRAMLGSLVALVGVGILAAIASPSTSRWPASGWGSSLRSSSRRRASCSSSPPAPTRSRATRSACSTGALILVPISFLLGEQWALPTQSDTWAAMIYLVVPGSLGVFWLFVVVLRRWTASAVSFEFLLIPLATIPFSALLTGEVITPLMLVAGAIILAGVYLGALAPDPRQAATEQSGA